MRDIPAEIAGLCCLCGAQRNESRKRCRKCSARGRWFRRKAWRTHKDPIRYRTGKK
jgi:hypothetical protein